MKYVFTVALVLAAAWLWLRAAQRGQNRPVPTKSRAAAPREALQAMVACAHCGLHLPQSDALLAPDGQTYCSDAHRRAGPR